MRQQAEVEAAKLGAKKAQEKGGGWFGGWFGGKKKSDGKKDEDDISMFTGSDWLETLKHKQFL